VGSFIFKKVKIVSKNDLKNDEQSEQKDEEKPELWRGRMACDLDFHCHANYYPSGVKEKKHRNTTCEEGVNQW
jgi:hypothetical protein